MSLYEDNLSAMNRTYRDIAKKLREVEDRGTVFIGDAADGGQFLAVLDGERLVSLASIYSPAHEAGRFMLQFEEAAEKLHVLLFGLGSGEAVREILGNKEIFEECIVYEPSIDVLRKAAEAYPLKDILTDRRLKLFVHGINDGEFYPYLEEDMDYLNWEFFRYVPMPKYQELFQDQEEYVYGVFSQLYRHRNVDQNTLIHYAKRGSDNEILSFQWLINGKSIYAMKQHLPKASVCIVVAAGPSLEKNVEELKKAKGKALIFCVDSAAKMLLKHGILPDLLCTVDPEKGGTPLEDERLSTIPIAVSPESDHVMLEMMRTPKVMCFSAGNEYHQRLFREAGYDMPYFYGGGSVATNCFKLAAELGFRTIILMGQDLALQGKKIHAGSTDTEETLWKEVEVEGYYGGTVTTLTDFKLYLDWYAAEIPYMTGCRVINATEGGAKIIGAEPMKLSEAIESFCKSEFDFEEICSKVPEIWNTPEKKQTVCKEWKNQRNYLKKLEADISHTIEEYKRTMGLYQQRKLTQSEAGKVNASAQKIMKEITEGRSAMLLYKRMLKTELEFRNQMYEVSKQAGTDDLKKQEIMVQYLNEALTCVKEMAGNWDIVLKQADRMS